MRALHATYSTSFRLVLQCLGASGVMRTISPDLAAMNVALGCSSLLINDPLLSILFSYPLVAEHAPSPDQNACLVMSLVLLVRNRLLSFHL